MKTIKYYKVVIPFKLGSDAKETSEEYGILAQNKHGKLVINDYAYTTLQIKKERYSSHMAINEIKVWKCNLGVSSDGWQAYSYYQCSEKVMRRKILNAIKKELSKEMFLSDIAMEKLEQLLGAKKR